MQRIVILGSPGSGKSTLARRLGDQLRLPVVHLDALFWGPGWVQPDREDFRNRLAAAISGAGWICEGNYAVATFDLRLQRADVVIILSGPRFVCLWRVLKRSLTGRRGADFPQDCHERLDAAYLEFLRYVWTFDRLTWPHVEAERQAKGAEVPVVRLRGQQQIDAFVRSIG